MIELQNNFSDGSYISEEIIEYAESAKGKSQLKQILHQKNGYNQQILKLNNEANSLINSQMPGKLSAYDRSFVLTYDSFNKEFLTHTIQNRTVFLCVVFSKRLLKLPGMASYISNSHRYGNSIKNSEPAFRIATDYIINLIKKQLTQNLIDDLNPDRENSIIDDILDGNRIGTEYTLEQVANSISDSTSIMCESKEMEDLVYEMLQSDIDSVVKKAANCYYYNLSSGLSNVIDDTRSKYQDFRASAFKQNVVY